MTAPTTADPGLLERLAELEHRQWRTWAEALLAAEPGLSAARRARWQACLVPYAALAEPLKDLDRAWAREALAIITAAAARPAATGDQP